MKQPPCKGCEIRQHGCHGRCESYAAWRADMKKIYEAKMIENNADSFRTASFMKAKHDWIRSHK